MSNQKDYVLGMLKSFLKAINQEDVILQVENLHTKNGYGLCFLKELPISSMLNPETLMELLRGVFDELKQSELTIEFRNKIKSQEEEIEELKEQIFMLHTKLEFDETFGFTDEEQREG